MTILSDLRARIQSLLFGTQADGESVEEFEFHLEMETQKLVERGIAEPEARRRARLAFGSLEAIREETRDSRGVRWMEDTVRDVRYAIRQLTRAPSFALATALTLGLGIGATAAIFSVLDGVLLRRAPFEEAERLVVVWEQDRNSGTTREPASWPDLVDLRAQSGGLTLITALRGSEVTFAPEGGAPVRVPGMQVNASYFRLTGVAPLLGRTFTPEEDVPGGARVVLIGEGFWRTALGADSLVLERTIRLDDVPYRIIGVLPSGTDFGMDQIHRRAAYSSPYSGDGEADLWLPIQTDETLTPRSTHPFLTMARLAPGASIRSAREETVQIGARLEEAYPDANRGRGMDLEPFNDVVFATVRPALALLVVAAGLVLTVAMVNVTNLLLARGLTRQREIAVRTALGATRTRLGRQILMEVLVLTLLGMMVGLGLAAVGLDLMLARAPENIPRIAQVRLDPKILLLGAGLSVLVGGVLALLTTIAVNRTNTRDIIRGVGRSLTGTRAQHRLRQFLVAAEIAVSVALVVSAGLLIRSFGTVLNVDPGFQVDGVFKAQYQLPASRYPMNFSRYPDLPEVQGFNTNLLERAAVLPGIIDVALSGTHPLDRGFTNSFVIVGREAEAAEWPEISVRSVSAGYFSTMRLPILLGRGFTDGDGTGAPTVAVINQEARRQFFANRSPIGQQIRFWGTNRQIVGVVADERFHGLTEGPPPAVYSPLSQTPFSTGVLLVRTAQNQLGFGSAIRQAILDVDPELAVYGIEPLTRTIEASVADRRFTMLIIGVLAGLTLVLSLVGLHGVLSYIAAQKTREIGIRSALGASRRGLLGQVMMGGLIPTVSGIFAGVSGAAVTGRFLSGMLYGIGPLDPVTFVGVPVLMLTVATVTLWVPARRAIRVDPTLVLREE